MAGKKNANRKPRKPRKPDSKRKSKENLTLQDLEIMDSLEVRHKTWDETQEAVGVSRFTIAQTRKKAAYRDLVIAALAQRQITVDTFAGNLADLMKARKEVVVRDEGLVEVDDNVTRLNATLKFGDILGVDAPKDFNLKHSMATLSDDELQEAIDESKNELDGRIKNRITGAPAAKAAITNTVISQEPAMAEAG